jgi:hypothetical protein
MKLYSLVRSECFRVERRESPQVKPYGITWNGTLLVRTPLGVVTVT